MKNKRAKQMIVDINLKGRKIFWYQDITELFLAKSLEDIEEEFGEKEENRDKHNNLFFNGWRIWWSRQLNEINWKDGIKGKPLIEDGERTEWEILPLICSVYGDENDVIQVSTGEW